MTREAPRVLIDHHAEAGPTVVQVRGSLIVSSLQTLRELDLFERYSALLPRPMHDKVVYAIASCWLPVDVALAHYAACEALDLDEQALEAIGKHVGNRISGTFLATMVRGARQVGMDTRTLAVLGNYHRMWDRLMMGGSCRVTQTGPKDVTIDSAGMPMLRYRYFRTGYAALVGGTAATLGRAVYAKVLRANDTSMSLGVSWV